MGVENDELVITRVARFNEGKYVCNATNQAGWQTAEFHLKIMCTYGLAVLSCFILSLCLFLRDTFLFEHFTSFRELLNTANCL